MTNSLSLYEIDQAIRDIIEAADENGEIDTEAFDKLVLAKKDKQFGVIKFLNYLDGCGEKIKAEIDRLTKLKTYAKARHEKLSEYLKKSMEIDGVKELDFVTFRAKIAKNPPAVIVDDESKIPPKFIQVTTTTSPKKAEIKTAIESGEEVPGCHIEQKERLKIS